MKTTLFILCIAACSLSSCFSDCGDGQPNDVFGASISINFRDKATGKFLYGYYQPLYRRDSLKIFDESGIQSELRWRRVDDPMVSFSFYTSQADEESFERERCKKYFVHYNSTEFDTLQICFRSRYIRCGSEYEYVNLHHNGNLIADDAIYNVIDIFKE